MAHIHTDKCIHAYTLICIQQKCTTIHLYIHLSIPYISVPVVSRTDSVQLAWIGADKLNSYRGFALK